MERTWKPKTAGVLSIIAGVIEVIFGALIIQVGGILGSLGGDWGNWLDYIGGLGDFSGWGDFGMIPGIEDIMSSVLAGMLIFGVIVLVFGIIAIVGGIHSIKRRRWGLALTGAILSFPFIPVGAILGLLAVIFVCLGKKEFEYSGSDS
ncbi:MAG: hypothetical protein PHY18_03125 [Dehalococcoidales bacterium]|nr:hypothetical protein [Dehalococcoidales bacterium]